VHIHVRLAGFDDGADFRSREHLWQFTDI
jgi:hypothetical protein